MQFPWQKKAPALSVVKEAPQTVQPPRDELEILQEEITLQQRELLHLEEENQILGQQLAEAMARSSEHKIEASDGHSDAHLFLDSLQREETVIARQREGLRLRIERIQTRLTPKLRRATELSVQADAIRQNEIVADLTAKADCMTAEL